MSAQGLTFFIFAVIAVFAAVMVISGNNPVHSALWLILNLVSIAVLYYTLNAPFLMAVQLIVYAGAIVVLFLFVVMLLSSRGQAAGVNPRLRWLTPASYIGALLLAFIILFAVWTQPRGVTAVGVIRVLGTPSNIGQVLYSAYLLPFEATSILLLAALVGALYLGRHANREELDEYLHVEEAPGPLSGVLAGENPDVPEAAQVREETHV